MDALKALAPILKARDKNLLINRQSDQDQR